MYDDDDDWVDVCSAIAVLAGVTAMALYSLLYWYHAFAR